MRFWLYTLIGISMSHTSVFAQTQCQAESPSQTVQLVELYTSEGCSSCPPADHWLSRLPANHALIPLAFHVDYWNYLGWKDRFSDARFTQRQRGVGAYNRQATIYTPEVVVNGKEHRRWHTGMPTSTTEQSAINFSVDADFSGKTIKANISSDQAIPSYAKIYMAVTESNLETAVKRGENRGRDLKHDHVVRAYSGPHTSAQTVALEVPTDLVPFHAALVVWLEDTRSGRTLQALSMPLKNCANAIS